MNKTQAVTIVREYISGAFGKVSAKETPNMALFEVEWQYDTARGIAERVVEYRETYVSNNRVQSKVYTWVLNVDAIESDTTFDFHMRASEYNSRSIEQSHLKRTLLGNDEVKSIVNKLIAVSVKMGSSFMQSVEAE